MFFKWANSSLFLLIFLSFQHYIIQLIDESIDGVLGFQTRGGRMEGTDESTDLWWLPSQKYASIFFRPKIY